MAIDLEEQTTLEIDKCHRLGTYAKAGIDKDKQNAWYCTYHPPNGITEYCINQGKKVAIHKEVLPGVFIREIYCRCMR